MDRLVLASTTPTAQFSQEAQTMVEKMATPQQKAVLPKSFEGGVGSQAAFDECWGICLPLYFHEPDDAVCKQLLSRTRGEVDVASCIMAREIPGFAVRDRLPVVSAPNPRAGWSARVGDAGQPVRRHP